MSSIFKGSKPKAKDMTPTEFTALRSPTSSSLQSIMGSGGLPQYGGQMVAGITGPEAQILESLGTGAPSAGMQGAEATLLGMMGGGQQNPFMGFGGNPVYGAQQNLLMSILGGEGLAQGNPHLQGAIDAALRPLIEQFGDQMLGARSQFALGGHSVGQRASSPFDMAAARLQTGLADAMGDVSTRMSFQNFDNERNRMIQALGLSEDARRSDMGAFEGQQDRALSAAGMAPQMQRAQLEQTLAALEAQALPRLIEQMGLDRGLEEFRRQQQSLLQAIGMSGQLGSATPVVLPGQDGLLHHFAGGLGQSLGMAAGGGVGGAIGGALMPRQPAGTAG